jgi:hypothetical protein
MSNQPDLPAWQLEQVRSALELIAADPQAQFDHVERLGTAPSLDEVALEFEDVRGLIPGLVHRGLAPQQLEHMAKSIEDSFHEMEKSPDLWSRDALDRPQWQSLRTLGRQALRLISSSEDSLHERSHT